MTRTMNSGARLTGASLASKPKSKSFDSSKLSARQFLAVDGLIDLALNSDEIMDPAVDHAVNLAHLKYELVRLSRELAIAFGMSKEYVWPRKRRGA